MSERAKEIAAAFDHALGLHRAGRKGEALEAYRKILADDPNHVEALTYSGVVLLEQGKAKEAVEILQDSVALEPNGAAANGYLANALQVVGRPEEPRPTTAGRLKPRRTTPGHSTTSASCCAG